jgi:hypothetical protein
LRQISLSVQPLSNKLIFDDGMRDAPQFSANDDIASSSSISSSDLVSIAKKNPIGGDIPMEHTNENPTPNIAKHRNRFNRPYYRLYRMKIVNGEMLTWLGSGSRCGLVLGFFLGLLGSIAIFFGMPTMDGLDRFRAAMPFAIYLILPILFGWIGAMAGAVIGIGTPKFNPAPQQGVEVLIKRTKSKAS